MLYNTVIVCTVVVLFFVVSLELDLVLPDRLKPALFPNNLCIFLAHTKLTNCSYTPNPVTVVTTFFIRLEELGK